MSWRRAGGTLPPDAVSPGWRPDHETSSITSCDVGADRVDGGDTTRGQCSGADRASVATEPWRRRSHRQRAARRDTGRSRSHTRRRGTAGHRVRPARSDDVALARSPALHAGRRGRELSRSNNRFPCPAFAGTAAQSALADVDRLRAEASRTTLDVGLQAVNAFLMVQERRRTAGARRRTARVRARRGQRRQCPLRQWHRAAVGCPARRGRGGPARGVCPRARERSAGRRSHAQHEPRAGRGRSGAAASRLSRSRSRLLPGRPSRRR